ncbi:hypothetical protein V9W64_00025 [Neisseria leonii]|uniref:Uncharacterized protein n=1 Tax=Neisseria leonii TaxID=2995413 RepID=A0A9X4DZJ6_9NEIS|nr:hypothetical protein [Neisseria sp. 51.81]MDD9326763.1 hypothetical protein [Neisseria sp. 51.81]
MFTVKSLVILLSVTVIQLGIIIWLTGSNRVLRAQLEEQRVQAEAARAAVERIRQSSEKMVAEMLAQQQNRQADKQRVDKALSENREWSDKELPENIREALRPKERK